MSTQRALDLERVGDAECVPDSERIDGDERGLSSASAVSPCMAPHPNSHAASADSPASNWLRVPQPRLGAVGMIFLLCCANAICPFAIDMYTPAVPSMPAQFSTTAALVNLTILGFYLFYTIGMLVFGPVSDRVGRKPVLVGGMTAFAAGSLLCALAWSIWTLIVFRVVQALGAGAVCAVSTAIIKDCFKPEKRTQLLSILQVLIVVGPVIAPLLGGFILQFSTWHATFAALAIMGALCLILTCLFKESLPACERVHGGAGELVRRMVRVATNRGFTVFLLVMSLFSVAYMAYVAVASYVYVDHFGTTEQVYSYFFAATAAISVCGPFVYLGLSKWMSPRRFTWASIAVCLVASAVLLVWGDGSEWVFFACFAVFITAEAAIRPYATDILLAQQDEDAGSASSVINFTASIFGVAGMGLVTAFSFDYVLGLGVLMLASMVLALGLWVYLLRSKRAHVREFER